MNFSIIEGLTDEELNELYDDSLNTGNFVSVVRAYCYCGNGGSGTGYCYTSDCVNECISNWGGSPHGPKYDRYFFACSTSHVSSNPCRNNTVVSYCVVIR